MRVEADDHRINKVNKKDIRLLCEGRGDYIYFNRQLIRSVELTECNRKHETSNVRIFASLQVDNI